MKFMRKGARDSLFYSRFSEIVALALLFVFFCIAIARPILAQNQDIEDGVNWLLDNQNASGSWGVPSLTEFRDTSVVLEVLKNIGADGQEYRDAISFINAVVVDNNDSLARKTTALADAGFDVSGLVNDLLAAQNPQEIDNSVFNFPEGGWGPLNGYSTNNLDTLFALDALNAAGLAGGLAVSNQSIGPGETDEYQFELPADATSLSIVITSLTGAIDFRIRQGSPPTLADPFFALNFAPVNLAGLPLQPGTNYIRIDSSVSSTYSFEVSFVASGFDTKNLLTPINYLIESQNLDGGWGLSKGLDSNGYLTSKVLIVLAEYSTFFDLNTVVTSGINWLIANRQNPDGGFSEESGVSTVYETALAAMAIAATTPASPAAGSAATYLETVQQANGSWDDDPYATALALQAVAGTRTPAAPDIISDGGAGSGMDFITNLDTATIEVRASIGTTTLGLNLPSAAISFDSALGVFIITINLADGDNVVAITALNWLGRGGTPTTLTITRDSTLSSQVLDLVEGLNPVGITLNPANPLSAEGLLELLGPNALELQRLDRTTGVYETVRRDGIGGFIGTNFALGFLDAINIISDATSSTRIVDGAFSDSTIITRIVGSPMAPAIVDLFAGTNQITLPDPPADLDAYTLLQEIGDETVVSCVQGLNLTNGVIETAVYNGGVPTGINFPVEKGIGYWVYMHTDLLDFTLPGGPAVMVSITNPVDGATVNTSPLTVSGTVSGTEPVTVTVNGVAATVNSGNFNADINLVPGVNAITATATDAVGSVDSDAISVTFEAVDFSIPRGGSAAGTRIFTADSAVLDQVNFFTENQIGVPAGITYATTGVGRISATEIQVSFTITIDAVAALGIAEFQVEYGLLDANSNPLGPLSGNIFSFRVAVTP